MLNRFSTSGAFKIIVFLLIVFCVDSGAVRNIVDNTNRRFYCQPSKTH